MSDLLITGATLPDGRTGIDVLVDGGQVQGTKAASLG